MLCFVLCLDHIDITCQQKTFRCSCHIGATFIQRLWGRGCYPSIIKCLCRENKPFGVYKAHRQYLNHNTNSPTGCLTDICEIYMISKYPLCNTYQELYMILVVPVLLYFVVVGEYIFLTKSLLITSLQCVTYFSQNRLGGSLANSIIINKAVWFDIRSDEKWLKYPT